MYTKLPNGQIVYEEDYSCIVEPHNGRGGIFIGNLEASQNIKTLKKHGIKAVLTAAKGVDLTHSKADVPYYLQIQGEDRDGFDLTRFFPQAINFISEALETTNIMVHCLAGVSRSVCLVLAYFIKCKGMTYDEAYRLVKSKRSIIHPNDGFIAQLKKYEREVRMCEPCSGQSYQKGYSASPTKKSYEYYYSPEKPTRNYDIYERRDYTLNYQSPSKNATLNYESPSKYAKQDIGYESPRKYDRYQGSPSRRPVYEHKYNYDVDTPVRGRHQTASPRKTYEPLNPQPEVSMYAKRGLGVRRLMSMAEHIQDYEDRPYISPERKQTPVEYVPRGRSTSDIKANGIYEKKYQHTSTLELSEELDNKIAMIRKKYAEYTQSSLATTKGSRHRDIEPKLNNYLDQNDIGLSGGLGLRKITSDYDNYGQKLGNQYGAIKNNLGRSSVTGLGLRKLNSMRDAY